MAGRCALRPLFICLFIALPGLPYPSICWAYRRILSNKLTEIQTIVQPGGILEDYLRAFRSATPRAKDETIQTLFNLHYSPWAYVLPVVINMIVSIAAATLCLVRAGLVVGLPTEVLTALSRAPQSVIAGIGGAYLWGLFDILSRYKSNDLSPNSLHFIWLRLLIASVLSPLVTLPLKEGPSLVLAFAVGAFPVKHLQDFVKAKANFLIPTPQPFEGATLQHIQGLTKALTDRLSEEQLDSITHIANADPLHLLLRTNIEWKMILDIIDQAILLNYLGTEKVALLRPLGFRGAIELAALGSIQPANKSQQAATMVELLATTLALPPSGVRHLIDTLASDAQVSFISNLWGAIGPRVPVEQDVYQKITNLGITDVYASRNVIESRRWCQWLREATRHAILFGIAHGNWCRDADFEPALRDRLLHGVEVTMLFLDPTSLLADARSKEDKRNTVAAIRSSISIMWNLRKSLGDESQRHLTLYVYTATPSSGMTWIDSSMIVTHYLAGFANLTSPAFHVQSVTEGAGLYDTYDKNLKAIEEDSATVKITDDNVTKYT